MFRKLWLLVFCFVMGVPGAVPGADILELFNGKDLEGWVVEGTKDLKEGDQVKPVWTVRDGMVCCAGKGFGFLRYKGREFGDFLFHVEYRLAPRANSGIGIRTVPFAGKANTRPSFAAYEIQLLDDAGKKPTAHSSGSLYRYVAPRINPVKPAPEWNSLDIECLGPRIRISINGQEILDVDQTTVPEIRDKPLKGYVSVQNHGSKVEFRKIYIKEKAKGHSPKGKEK